MSRQIVAYGKMDETGDNECSERTFKIRRRSTNGTLKSNVQSNGLLCKHIEKRNQDRSQMRDGMVHRNSSLPLQGVPILTMPKIWRQDDV
jgi:hypothetical protein